MTALTPLIGYTDAAAIAEAANADGSPLRDAALKSGKVDETSFDKVVNPSDLIGHGVEGA